MKNWKRLFSCVLIVCMLVSLSPAVFAADDSSEPVQIADGESVTVGNVTVTEGGDAVSASAFEGESTTLTVEGDVKQTSEDWVYPVNVYANEENASATVNVTGSVVAEGEGGSIVYVGVDGGDATASVGGDASLKATGDDVYVSGVDSYITAESGTSNVSIGGDLDVSGSNTEGVSVCNRDSREEWNSETGETEYTPIESSSAETTVTVAGNITASGENNATGVNASSTVGATATVEVGGNVSAEGDDATGVQTEAFKEGTTSVKVGGDVSAEGGDYSNGVQVNAYEKGTATMEVGGDVSVESDGSATGINANASSEGDATVHVDGDVTASAEGSATGVNAYAGTDATTTVEIGGDVSTEGKYATGLDVFAADKGEVSVTVAGNVSAKEEDSENGSTAVWVSAYEGGSADVHVVGDVDGGIALSTYGEQPSEIKVTVEGTVSGGKAAVTVSPGNNNSDEVTLLLWKAELNENGNVVEAYQYDPEDFPEEMREEVEKANEENAADAAKLEDNILYIIKLEQLSEGGELSVSGTEKVDGFDVAKEGDNVILKIAIADGYKLNGAYNGLGEKVALLQDSNGDYYVIVPKGGGVYLSADVSKIASPQYIPATKKLIAQTDNSIAVTVTDKNGNEKESKLNIRFFDDHSFEIRIDGLLRIKGDYKFVGDDLVFVLKDGAEIKANDAGQFVFELDGGNISFTLNDEFVKDLKTKTK